MIAGVPRWNTALRRTDRRRDSGPADFTYSHPTAAPSIGKEAKDAMRKAILGSLILGATSMLSLGGSGATIRAVHDDDDRYREPRRPYANYYGQRANSGPVLIGQAIRDLEVIASRSRVDRHEQRHFQRALEELHAFQYRAREGRFDRRRLDSAIEHIDHLAGADQLHPSARGILRRDLYQLRRLRSDYRHSGYSRPPYGR